MSCEPSYQYRPTFVARTELATTYDPATWIRSPEDCTAPGYPEHRARVFVSGLFFRSKEFGPERNRISIELPTTGTYANKFVVRFDGDVVETYTPTLGVGGIASLRSLITANDDSIIEMPELNFDIYDERTEENDVAGDPLADPPTTDGGLITIPLTNLTGGMGGPTSNAGLSSIRTGPERTIVIITTTEYIDGKTDPDVPLNRKTRQWNGTNWINYSNTIPGACPKEGT